MVSPKKFDPRPGTLAGGSVYPWDRWFSRPVFRVRPRDYACSQSGMVQQIRNMARRRRVYVSVDADRGGGIAVRVSRTPFLRRKEVAGAV